MRSPFKQSPAVPSHPGATSFLDSAMVQAAVYDAVEAIMADSGRTMCTSGSLRLASGGRRQSHSRCLVGPLPSLTASLDMTYHHYLAAHGSGGERSRRGCGPTGCRGIIVLRANNGSFPLNSPAFTGGTRPRRLAPDTPLTFPDTPTQFAALARGWPRSSFTLDSSLSVSRSQASVSHEQAVRDRVYLGLFWAATIWCSGTMS